MGKKGTWGCFWSEKEGSRTVSMSGKGHGPGQPLALTVIHVNKEEMGGIITSFSMHFPQKTYSGFHSWSILQHQQEAFPWLWGAWESEGSQMFFQLNWHAWKHWMPTSKCSGVLHLLVGYASASPPGEHCTWSFRTASSQRSNTAAGTVRCKAPSSSASGKMRCSTGEPWGGGGGRHSSLWSLTNKGGGADKGAVLHEQFTMRWISLRHCWEARDVSRGGNSPPRWRGMTGSSCTGSLAPVPPGPAALRQHREAWCHLVSGWGQRWVPGHQRAQSALLGQRNRKSF